MFECITGHPLPHFGIPVLQLPSQAVTFPDHHFPKPGILRDTSCPRP